MRRRSGVCYPFVLLVTLLTSSSPVAAAAGERKAVATQDAASAREASPSASLARQLEPIRAKHRLPALGAAVIVEGRLDAVAAVGVRKLGSDVKVTAQDAFHIGSCTKAMTAFLTGMLVEEEKLRWDLTLAEAFPDLAAKMHRRYRGVTLEQLLAHRGGLPPNVPPGKTLLDLHRLRGSAIAKRRAYLAMLLTTAPQARPGTQFVYSNAGYVVAAAMAERATKTSWEELIEQMLFGPLGMSTAGFGAMGTPGKTEQPWQHRVAGDRTIPVGPGPRSDNPPVLGPAGRVHCSLSDWSKFVAAHLAGARGEDGLLRSQTVKRLQTPTSGGDYAAGWIVTERPWGGGRVLTHAGSNTMNYAVAWVAPLRNFAVLVVTNQGGTAAPAACDEVAAMLIGQYLSGP